MVLLIGPERSDPIGGYGYLSLGAFDGLLVSQIHTVVCGQQENDTQNASCFATNLPSNQISPTDLLSVQANQIPPTDLLSVQANHITRTDLLSVQANQIARTDLLSVQANQIARTDLRSVQANQIARSVTGRISPRDQITRMVTDRTSDERQKSFT